MTKVVSLPENTILFYLQPRGTSLPKISYTFPENPIVLMKISWKSLEILLFLKKSRTLWKGVKRPSVYTKCSALKSLVKSERNRLSRANPSSWVFVGCVVHCLLHTAFFNKSVGDGSGSSALIVVYVVLL